MVLIKFINEISKKTTVTGLTHLLHKLGKKLPTHILLYLARLLSGYFRDTSNKNFHDHEEPSEGFPQISLVCHSCWYKVVPILNPQHNLIREKCFHLTNLIFVYDMAERIVEIVCLCGDSWPPMTLHDVGVIPQTQVD